MKRFSTCCHLLLALMPLFFSSCASLSAGNPAVTEGIVEAIESKDNPGMLVIPGGPFTMGANTADPSNRPEHTVNLPTFEIDKCEVSAGEFAEFLNTRGNPDDEYFSEDNYSTIVHDPAAQGKYLPRPGLDNYPANNVSWFGASAYCEWKDKRLPTEAEWEKAARGKDKRIYPWGDNMPDSSKADFDQKWEEKGFQVMVPVDALPGSASYYGVLNMAGNVWEWVNDWYKQSYCDFCDTASDPECINCYADIQYDVCVSAARSAQAEAPDLIEEVAIPEINPQSNPAGPSLGSFRVLRGGSWYDSYGTLVIRSTYRYWFDPSERYFNIGFRCAK